MPTNSDRSERQLEPINLKHRVTGAGVLILFGALVLPWLLGPPSEAKKDPLSAETPKVAERHSTFEDEVLSELQANPDFEEPEETVYVSKITPVNGEPKPAKPELQQSDSVAGGQPAGQKDTKEPNTQANNAAPVVEKPEKVKPKSATTKDVADKPAVANVNKNDNANASKTVKDTLKPSVSQSKVNVGWVVQVELLIDKNGAKKLVKELSGKGFEPHTTVVDTNRGPKTGTRIWLGPFEKRADAGAENDRLQAKMGKRGFLRVYP